MYFFKWFKRPRLNQVLCSDIEMQRWPQSAYRGERCDTKISLLESKGSRERKRLSQIKPLPLNLNPHTYKELSCIMQVNEAYYSLQGTGSIIFQTDSTCQSKSILGSFSLLGHTFTVQLIQCLSLQPFTLTSSWDRVSKNIFIFSRTLANINKSWRRDFPEWIDCYDPFKMQG